VATGRYFICSRCGEKTYPPNLFETLRTFSVSRSVCGRCGANSELHVVFSFGLEAGRPDCKVLDAFLPENPVSWRQQDMREVTFYPFLVVLQRSDDEGRCFWLPYWHLVEGIGTVKRKYGQWAPFMDASLFESLVAQARAKGHLVGLGDPTSSTDSQSAPI